MPDPYVLHLADYGGPYSGNFIASLRALGARLAQDGCHQTLAFSEIARGRPWLEELRAGGADVEIVARRPRMFDRVRPVLDLVRRRRPRIIHTHFTSFDGPAWTSRVLLRHLDDVKVVWHVHTPGSAEGARAPLRRAKDLLKYRWMGRGAYSIVVSEGGLEIMLRRGALPSRTFVVANGIDASRLRVADRDQLRDRMRTGLGVAESDFVVAMYGWDPLVKGVDIALRGVEEVNASGMRAVLVVVGQQPLREFLHRLYGATLPSWLRVLDPQEEVSPLLCATDVFLSSSREEGFSYAAAEALVSGVPLICTDIPGLTWTRGNPAVVRYPPLDSTALAAQLRSVAAWRAEERDERTRAASTIVQDTYGVDRWAEGIYNIYRTIGATNARRAG